jgi:hypothetical protein
MNAMLRTALKTRWHTSYTRVRNAMRSIASFSIIKFRKRGENYFFRSTTEQFPHFQIRCHENSINAYQHVLSKHYSLDI